MERNNLIKQLKSLSETKAGGHCREAWVRDTRAVLMEKATQDAESMPVGEVKQMRFAIDMGAGWQKMMRPAVAMAVIVVLLFGGSIATVSASYGSLPGDALYSIKIFSEGAQLSLVPGKENKTKMRMDFAGRRLDEVAKLVETPVVEKEKKIGEAVGRFKKNIEEVNKDLDKIKQQKNKKKAVQVAKDVDRKAEEYGEAIKKAINKVPAESKKEVKKAKAVVDEVGVKAVEVLIEKHAEGETEEVTEEEIIEKINKKIQQAEETIAEVEGDIEEAAQEAFEEGGEEVVTEEGGEEVVEESEEGTEVTEGEEPVEGEATEETTDQAKENIEEAKVLLDSKDLLGALGAVKEANTLASAAEEEIGGETTEEVVEETGESVEGEETVEGATTSTEEIVTEETEEPIQQSTTTEEVINTTE